MKDGSGRWFVSRDFDAEEWYNGGKDAFTGEPVNTGRAEWVNDENRQMLITGTIYDEDQGY